MLTYFDIVMMKHHLVLMQIITSPEVHYLFQIIYIDALVYVVHRSPLLFILRMDCGVD